MRAARTTVRATDPNLVALEIEQVEKRMKKYNVPPVGYLKEEKPEGFHRFMSTQPNNMSTILTRSVKIEQTTRLINKYDVDMVSFLELGLNWKQLPPSETLASFFDAEVELRSVTGHNKHENPPTTYQPGGTGLLAVSELIQYCKTSGTDHRNLGRWTWYVLEGSPEHKTIVLSVYHIGKSKPKLSKPSNGRARPKGWQTCYQQHLRYIQNEGLDTTPYELFCADLLNQLRTWREQGYNVVMVMDANEHVLTGQFTRQLANVGLQEVSHKQWGDSEPNTHIDGSQPIDGVWISRGLELGGLVILPFSMSVGDHRTIIFDLSTRSLIGKFEHRIVRSACRRLNTKNSSLGRYTKILDRQMAIHRMYQRLDAIIDSIVEDKPTPKQKALMEALDVQFIQLQTHAERKCRKILKPDLQFSGPVKLWHERLQAYQALIRWKTGNAKNDSNIMRTALRRGIENPREMSLEMMQEGMAYAKARKLAYKHTHPELRRDFVRTLLLKAESENNEVKAKGIKQNMEREGKKKMWYFINRSQKDPHSKAPHVVSRMEEDVQIDSTTKEETEQFVFDENEFRFQLAAGAPISKTKLMQQIGCLADTEIAKQLIEGNYDIPYDVDDATALILEEIGRIGVQVTNGDITITISAEEFQYYWKRVKESTSSSYSGIHYGHYKAAAHSDKLSGFLAKKITLIARTGCPPERWSYGLTVMLEKIAGIALVNKLRAILLMEADFNFHNKLIFGKRMVDVARAEGLIPPEQYATQQSTSEDGSFDKILESDISRQKRLPLCIISADAANCYDRVHHLIIALLFLALGVGSGSITAMLSTIQLMKFFLKTGWGESQSFMGGNILRILHGLCQGNGAAPAAWLMLSSVLVTVYKNLGFGSTVESPMTRVWLENMGVLFVDDTDLFIMNECVKSGYDVWEESQGALTAWGKLLISTGGMLKPEKCFCYMVDYDWGEDGSWSYVDVTKEEPLLVPQADNASTPIAQLPVNESKKTLGVWTNPAGDCAQQLTVLTEKMEEWTNRLVVGKLPAKWGWVSYFHQLWARLKYGLGCNASPVAELLQQEEEEGGPLRKLYRKMLPYLGVNRNIKFGWRHLHSSFGGIGLRKLLTEVAIGRINLFVQHYNAPSPLGKKLTTSLEGLQLEAGTNICPLLVNYHPMGPITTPCWVRSFWECLDHYNFELNMDYPVLEFPRENDVLIISLFEKANPTAQQLTSWNRCRIRWGFIFLSDPVSASGRTFDERYLDKPGLDRERSTKFKFGEERPSDNDWREWKRFWRNILRSDGTLVQPLGKWLHPSHHIWEWFYDDALNVVERQRPDGVDHFFPSPGLRRTRGEQLFTLEASHGLEVVATGVPCTVRTLDDGSVCLLDHGPPLVTGPSQPDSFFEFLKRWRGEWMWANIVNEGHDLRWVVEALQNGTAIWVTDGSFIKEIAPNISGAGWIVYDTATELKMYGSFAEESPFAGSYRGELLGLLAIHTLCAAIEEFYKIIIASSKICCDNQGALLKSEENRRRIPTGASQADIKRSLRNVKAGLVTQFTYEWVESHQDRYKLWNQLTLTQQLNCHCDTLAKRAVRDTLKPIFSVPHQPVLPKESAAVFINNIKQTSDVAKEVRFALGHVDAEKFYTTPLGERNKHGQRDKRGGLGWSKASFDAVDWRALDSTLDPKPQMYKEWLAKQCSGFCGTQSMVARWDHTRNGLCPNCGKKEDAAHLNVCTDRERTRLLNTMADNLAKWLATHHAHPSLLYWIPRYIKLRGSKTLGDFRSKLTHEMALVARSQDLIPWKSFLEGKVSKELLRLQYSALVGSASRLTMRDWTKQFISQLLHISHAQWVFRNVSLHDRSVGYLQKLQRRKVLLEIDRLSQLSPSELPDDSKYLLEMDFSTPQNSSLIEQSYWILAMKAAICAGRRVRRRRSATTQRLPAPRQRRTTSTRVPRHDIATGEATQRHAQRRISRTRPLPTQQAFMVDGAANALRDIRLEWSMDPPPSRTRPHPSTSFLEFRDCKRRRPD